MNTLFTSPLSPPLLPTTTVVPSADTVNPKLMAEYGNPVNVPRGGALGESVGGEVGFGLGMFVGSGIGISVGGEATGLKVGGLATGAGVGGGGGFAQAAKGGGFPVSGVGDGLMGMQPVGVGVKPGQPDGLEE